MSATWSLHFADDRGTEGHIRLAIDARASYDAVLTLPGLGFVVVRDDDLRPSPPPLIEVRGDGLWAEFVCETPGEHWGFALEAFGLRFADADEARTSDRGDRLPVGIDLEWEAPERVVGEILAGPQRWTVDGRGTFNPGAPHGASPA
jgi:hypothetical protein